MKEGALVIVIASMLVSAGIAMERENTWMYWLLISIAILLHDCFFCVKTKQKKETNLEDDFDSKSEETDK